MMFVVVTSSCAVIYPELATPRRAVATGQPLQAPPANVKWLCLDGADIPARTRDGRRWDGEETLPEPYAKVFLNSEPLLVTKPEGRTRKPNWTNAPCANFYIASGDRLRVELWDAHPVFDHPIGMREFGRLDESDLRKGTLVLDLESGAQLRVVIDTPHSEFGYGFFYELRSNSVYVTRTFEQSPASRAGIAPGDRILVINSRKVQDLSEGQIRTFFNAQLPDGLVLTIRRPSGQVVTIKLKEGAIYLMNTEVDLTR